MSRNCWQRSLWAVAACVVILSFSLGTLVGCRKKPAKSPEPTQSSPKPASSDTSARGADRLADVPTKTELTIQDVVRTARFWGPVYASWYGKPAPDFMLKDLEGTEHKLSSYRGKNVMLVFWATWCRPCQMEIPSLVQLRDSISTDRLMILGISYISPRNTAAMISSFVAQNRQINYPMVAAQDTSVPAPYNSVDSIPCSFFIDPEGKIKLATAGLIPLGQMKAILEAK